MRQIIKHIPNGITCLNLFAGCLSCVAALNGMYQAVVLCLAFSAVFDFLDGMSARLLNAYSPLGKELDSLADMVSFGLAPGLLVYHLYGTMPMPAWLSGYAMYVPYLAFLIPVFSALRLAKFNIDDRQISSFIGLPTPANAIFFVGLAFLMIRYREAVNVYMLTAIVILFSYLLVSEIPMFSLKVKNWSWKGARAQYMLLIFSLFCLFIFGIGGLAVAILIYVIMALFEQMAGTKL